MSRLCRNRNRLSLAAGWLIFASRRECVSPSWAYRRKRTRKPARFRIRQQTMGALISETASTSSSASRLSRNEALSSQSRGVALPSFAAQAVAAWEPPPRRSSPGERVLPLPTSPSQRALVCPPPTPPTSKPPGIERASSSPSVAVRLNSRPSNWISTPGPEDQVQARHRELGRIFACHGH